MKYVPKLRYNLLSLSAILSKFKSESFSEGSNMIIKFNKKISIKFKLIKSLFVTECLNITTNSTNNTNTNTTTTSNTKRKCG